MCSVERINFINPYTRVFLTFPVEEIKEALRFIFRTVKIDDLDDALVNCWQISGALSERERKMLSMVQTIVSGTKDGHVKPEDFDVYKLARKVAAEVLGKVD
jgi:hypothetical protein